jgi:hypothetical protein
MSNDDRLFPWEFFTVTAEHIALLPRLCFGWQDCEYGAPEVDPKRPYGNSDVQRDIAKILGWPLVKTRGGDDLSPEQSERADAIHREMATVLSILCACNGVQPGRYKCRKYGRAPWQRAD